MGTEQKLKILEDWGTLLAIDKPAGWLSIPGRGNKENIPVVSHILGAQLRGEKIRETKPDLYVVHRLDEGTTGVMIFAKTAESHRAAGALFETQKVKKEYWCVVKGRPDDQLISQPLLKLPSKKNKSVVSPQGKASETEIQVMASVDGFSLVKAIPRTGRSHQIRVHLSYVGCPLLGDSLYGGSKQVGEIQWPYPLLHCRQVEFPWALPSKTSCKATASPPDFFIRTLESLKILNIELL